MACFRAVFQNLPVKGLMEVMKALCQHIKSPVTDSNPGPIVLQTTKLRM